MRRFSFSLDRVLHWRRSQAELEEMRLEELFGQIRLVRSNLGELQRQMSRGEQALLAAARQGEAIEARDLAALEEFRVFARRRQQELRRQEAEIEWKISEQQKAVAEARRAVKALEKLRERKYEEWVRELDREEARLIDELFLSRRGREPGAVGSLFRG